MRRGAWGQKKCGAIGVARRLIEQQLRRLSRQRVAQGTGEESSYVEDSGGSRRGALLTLHERDASVRAATLARCCCLFCVLAVGRGWSYTSRWVRLLDSDATSARVEHDYYRCQDQDSPQDDDINELQHGVEEGKKVARGRKKADTERDRRRVEGRREGNMHHATYHEFHHPPRHAICWNVRVPSPCRLLVLCVYCI